MYNKELAGLMLNKLYHLKLWRVKRSEWRKRLSKWNLETLHYSADDFVKTWDYLEQNGLIRR